jgi:putative MATE family efflux protein
VPDANLPEDALAAATPRLRGDLTQGPILRTLVMFSIPAFIANMLQTIGGSINAIWVAQLLGESAVAATANANMILFLMFGTIFGFGMATTIKVGQHFGAKNLIASRRSFGSGIGFCTMLSVVVAILGAIYAEPVLRLMATPPEVMAQALAYLRIVFMTLPFTTVSLMVSTGLRGAGDATTPMLSMIISVVIGILLNPVLIAGFGPIPALGIAGSAIAGAIGALVGAVVMIATIYAKDLPLRLRGRELGFLFPNRDELAFMVGKGLPMGAQTLLSTAAGLVMLGLVNREGMMATAAYGASLQLWNYIQMPAFAVGTAVSTMVAQNVGAGQHDRVGRITGAGLWVTSAVTVTLTALMLAADRPLLGLFLGDSESPAVELGRHIQFICTWSFVLMGVMMVLFSTMRSYGAVITPLIIMFIALYPVRIGFYYLAYPLIGADALWWSYPVSSLIAALLSIGFYRWGRWRRPYTSALGAEQLAELPASRA